MRNLFKITFSVPNELLADHQDSISTITLDENYPGLPCIQPSFSWKDVFATMQVIPECQTKNAEISCCRVKVTINGHCGMLNP